MKNTKTNTLTINTIVINNKGIQFTVKAIGEDKKVTLENKEGTKVVSLATLKDKRSYTITDKVAKAPKEKAKAKQETKAKGTKSRILITYKGQEKSPADWGKEFNLDPRYIRKQLRKGKAPEEIFKAKESK